MDKLERRYTPNLSPFAFSAMANAHAQQSCTCPACLAQELEEPTIKPVDWFKLNREFSHG